METLAKRYSGQEEYDGIVFFDGLDEAFLGFAHRFSEAPIAAYDRARCIEIFISEGLSHEDAEEHFSYNVIGTWAGDRTPIFISKEEESNHESP